MLLRLQLTSRRETRADGPVLAVGRVLPCRAAKEGRVVRVAPGVRDRRGPRPGRARWAWLQRSRPVGASEEAFLEAPAGIGPVKEGGY